jgi:DMSO/TMAO reductase YedYZ heme-binding membrane subunit
MTDEQSRLPVDRLWQPTTVKWFAAILGVSLLYAITRYHLAGGIGWEHFPLFILNKVISLAAVSFVASSYLIGKIFRWHDNEKSLRLVVVKFCGLVGFFLAGIHAFMSFILLTPSYFAKYFQSDGRLNLQGEAGIAAGILALFFLMSPAITTLPMMPKALGGWRWKRTQRIGYLALLLVAVHLVFLGLKGWLTPEKWPSGLVPISLIAFVMAVLPLIVKRKSVRDQEQRRQERRALADKQNDAKVNREQ